MLRAKKKKKKKKMMMMMMMMMFSLHVGIFRRDIHISVEILKFHYLAAPPHPFNRIFDGPHSWPGCFGKQNSAMPWLRLLVSSVLPQRPGFSPSPVIVGFAMYVVTL
jgi:hypothetical protein